MALSDEINSCSFNADEGQRLRSRPQVFCDDVQMDSSLDVADATTLSSTLVVGDDAAFATKVAVTQALTLGAPIAPAKVETTTFRRAARSSPRATPPPTGDLSVAGLAHIGNELRLGSGYYASFKKDPAMTQVTEYVLPSSYPSEDGLVLSSSKTGQMAWTAGGGGSVPGFNQVYGFVRDPAPIGYDFGFI